MSMEKTRGSEILNGSKTLLVHVVAITIVLVLICGCFDNSAGGSTGNTYSGSSSCGTGYYKYSTSAGHCCPEGYPYYYDGKCHQCSQGYYQYDTSAGHCCPEGYPYYSDGKCWKQSGNSGSTGQQTTYYASCSQCQGYYHLYSYRGGSYETCNAYYQTCVFARCGKILDNCR